MALSFQIPDGRVVTVREINSSDSIDELTNFLHRAYRGLAEMGFRYYASHQSADETRRRISNATCLLALIERRIVGTLSLYTRSENSRCGWYLRPRVAHFGQFAVEPAFRGSGLGSFLLSHAEHLAAETGSTELALDTAEGASHLIAYYTKRDFRFIAYVQWDMTNYRSVVMSKTLGAE